MKNTQKGFITPLLLLFVIIALLLVGGGAYYLVQRYSQPQIPAPQEPVATSTVSNVPTQESGVPTKIYTNTENAFSIEYPTLLILKTSDLGTGSFAHPSAQGLVTINSQMLYGSTTSSGPDTLTISVSPDPADVGNCMVSPRSTASTTQINGVSFLTYGEGDAGMGHYTSDSVYHTIKNNKCYEIRKTENSYRTETDQQAQAQKESLVVAASQIDPIVQSFKFLTSTAVVPPPTCNLTAKEFSYALGDVVSLSWTSKNATRALWNQPVEGGTGLRKNIVPPEETPGINGTASTVANIEGYVPIILQVVGDGGFGTCSTQISVAHSDAKPSITIDSIKFTGAGAKYTNDRNVDVTLFGTATLGGLFNNEVNIVFFDVAYNGPFDEASVYSTTNRQYFYSGGSQPGVREDSQQFKNWSVETSIPHGLTNLRVLAYYPYYFSGSFSSQTQPIINEILTVSQ